MKDSREQILIASLGLFLRKNFKEVTMKEIVEQTGLSKGAFYHYFNSKEQVFEEVINYFFDDFLIEDFSLFPQDSLSRFYQGALETMENKVMTAKLILQTKATAFTANHYFLLFDGMKIIPAFKEKLHDHQKKEMKAWTKIMANARRNGEIRTEMSDEVLARLFIYSADGAGINLIMHDEMSKMGKELKSLWDGIYSAVKK
jgi:AcrR family transcriptional regulator